MCCTDRMYLCASVRCVDEVFVEDSLELKAEYCKRYDADLLVMGDDHVGRFDWVSQATGGHCLVKYLKRTPHISTSAIIEKCCATDQCSFPAKNSTLTGA